MSAPASAPSEPAAALVIARYAWRESLRRKVVPVVGVLTLAFLALYATGVHFAFKEVAAFEGPGTETGFTEIDDRALAGSTLTGLAMFAILFLGAILGTFLTLGVVRGDAETGLLQPIAARPLRRGTILGARLAGAGGVASAYVVAVFAIAVAITWISGDWTPDRPISAALLLGASVAVVTAISVLVSVFTSSTAQGIAVLMVFGAGLTAGLLGQIGDALSAETLIDISEWVSWLLPFEALYQDALYALTAETSGLTGFLLSLGPFGGAKEASVLLVPYAAAYVIAVTALASWVFGRRDL